MQVAQVLSKSDTDLRDGDVILRVGGKAVADPWEFGDALRDYRAGDTVKLTVRRGKAEAAARMRLMSPPERKRRSFPCVLQHDAHVRPDQCGGPLVDLDGRMVGLNIARPWDYQSYAIPVEALKPLLRDLASGKWAPPVKGEERKERSEPDRASRRDLSVLPCRPCRCSGVHRGVRLDVRPSPGGPARQTSWRGGGQAANGLGGEGPALRRQRERIGDPLSEVASSHRLQAHGLMALAPSRRADGRSNPVPSNKSPFIHTFPHRFPHEPTPGHRVRCGREEGRSPAGAGKALP